MQPRTFQSGETSADKQTEKKLDLIREEMHSVNANAPAVLGDCIFQKKIYILNKV